MIVFLIYQEDPLLLEGEVLDLQRQNMLPSPKVTIVSLSIAVQFYTNVSLSLIFTFLLETHDNENFPLCPKITMPKKRQAYSYITKNMNNLIQLFTSKVMYISSQTCYFPLFRPHIQNWTPRLLLLNQTFSSTTLKHTRKSIVGMLSSCQVKCSYTQGIQL